MLTNVVVVVVVVVVHHHTTRTLLSRVLCIHWTVQRDVMDPFGGDVEYRLLTVQFSIPAHQFLIVLLLLELQLLLLLLLALNVGETR